MKAILDQDLVVALVSGDVDGVSIPNELAALPPQRLRYVGRKFVDAATIDTFHVDQHGRLRAVKGNDRQTIKCAWNAPIERDGDRWVAGEEDTSTIEKTIKTECRRRITARLKDGPTQTNLAAYVSELLARRVLDKGKLAPSEIADIEISRAARQWVVEMQAACRRLVADGEVDFAADVHWPSPPDGLASLVARF